MIASRRCLVPTLMGTRMHSSSWLPPALMGLVLLAGLAGTGKRRPADPGHPARVRLVSERSALLPGQTNYIGLAFDIDPGWHLYWHGASDSGMPITFTLDLPAGVQ